MKIWQHWRHLIRHKFKYGFRQGINLLIPPQCPGCHAIVLDDGLCGQCWSRIKRITPPLCKKCGRRFPYEARIERCFRCLTQPPDFDRAIAGFGYNAMSRRLILVLKCAKRHDVTPATARIMANAGSTCYKKQTGSYHCPFTGHDIINADLISLLNWCVLLSKPRIFLPINIVLIY